MNKWNEIKAHYAEYEKRIMNCKKSEWAIDPYAWDEGKGMINFTPIEHMLWPEIRLHGAILYPQYPVNGVFVDFANPVAKIAIECDGKEFHDEAKDAERDRKLRAFGWIVYRISGSDCYKNFDADSDFDRPASNFIARIVSLHGIARDEGKQADRYMRRLFDRENENADSH